MWRNNYLKQLKREGWEGIKDSSRLRNFIIVEGQKKAFLSGGGEKKNRHKYPLKRMKNDQDKVSYTEWFNFTEHKHRHLIYQNESFIFLSTSSI
jgi:hypothetical protein